MSISAPINHAGLRKMIRAFLPPIALEVLSWFRSPEWEFVGNEWPQDDPRSGWDHPSVAGAMLKNWQAYKDAVEGTGPIALLPWSTRELSLYAHNQIMTYAFVLARAGHERQRLKVLDWGGALGHYATVGRALLPDVLLDYTVKERPNLCAIGKKLLPQVLFDSSDNVLSRRYDLVMAGGSIQFEKNWQASMASLAAAAEHWLFITQVPVIQKARRFVVVQRPFRVGMDTDYISWVFNRDEFLDQIENSGLKLDREFLCSGSSQEYRNAVEASELRGFLFKRQ